MAENKSDDEKEKESKPIIIRNTIDLQRLKLERLMKNPEKPVIIPERPKERGIPVVPDFVRNVMGSSAGAGSGEFHVYRHLRRKEYARQKYMKEKAEREKLDDEYRQKLEEYKKLAEEKTAKKRQKRLKKKQKSKKKPKTSKTTNQTSQSDDSEDSSSCGDSENENKTEDKGNVSNKEENVEDLEKINNETVANTEENVDSKNEEKAVSEQTDSMQADGSLNDKETEKNKTVEAGS